VPKVFPQALSRAGGSVRRPCHSILIGLNSIVLVSALSKVPARALQTRSGFPEDLRGALRSRVGCLRGGSGRMMRALAAFSNVLKWEEPAR
jgi:hypothetical protein